MRKILCYFGVILLAILMTACSTVTAPTISPSITPPPTETATDAPSEPWGIYLKLGGVGLEHLADAVPIPWRNPDFKTARYTVTVLRQNEVIEVCEYTPYGAYMEAMVTISRERIVIDARILDEVTRTVIARREFKGSYPATCPDSVSLEDGREFTYEGNAPTAMPFSSWLLENLADIEDTVLPSLTPSVTPTLTLTRTPRPTRLPTETYTPTSSPTARPIITPTITPAPEGHYLIVTGIVIVHDEFNNTVAHITEGEYTLLGFVEGSYVIEFEGNIGYVPLSSTYAQSSVSLTATPED